MAWDGWVKFGGTELFNVYRTARLAEDIGIDTVWLTSDDLLWIQDAGVDGGVDYTDITQAPWYDAGTPASAEFAGVLPLTMQGLDDSTRQSTPIEYITDGGNSGKSRNTTLSIVVSAAVIASTERGAEYGLRWLNRLLRGGSDTGSSTFCAGVDLTYFRYDGSASDTPPIAHRRDVRLTRGTSVTRKRVTDCSSTWMVTFTLLAADPYEYSEPKRMLDYMDHDENAVGDPYGVVLDAGNTVLTEETCPVYDYTPIYDPRYPALVPAPTAPNLEPAGWTIVDGMTFERAWCTLPALEPSGLNVVPVLNLTTDVEARMVRLSLWVPGTDPSEQCEGLLYSVIVSYLPVGQQFIIDGEQQAAYVWDGASPNVRRADSLIYSEDASPALWPAFPFEQGTMLTMDLFGDSDGYEGSEMTKVYLSLVQKSD